MKVDVRVRFELDSSERQRLAPLFAIELPEHGLTEGAQTLVARRSHPGLIEILDALRAEGIPFTEEERRQFSDCEIEDAAAVRLGGVLRAAPPPSMKTEYSLERACPLCLVGREQISDLVLDEAPDSDLGLSLTTAGHVIVGEAVARAMILEGMTGCILRGVRDRQDRVTDVFQILPVHTLPPLRMPPARVSKNDDLSCPGCGRGGLSVDSMLYYDLPEHEFTDVNVSRETVGAGPASHPELILSQRLFRVVLEHTDPTPEVEPVVLV